MTSVLRIAHISDTHLGYRALSHQDPRTGRNQRSVDVERAFSLAVDDILRQNIDLVLHAGDVFHQSRPNWHAVRHFLMEMRRIENAGIPAVVIAGNHDTPRYRAGGSVFEVLDVALPQARISAGYEEEEITLNDLGIRIQTVPHGALTNPDKPVAYVKPDMRNILLIHGMVPGILPPGMVTEPGEQELDTQLLEPGFAYIALGHYHIRTSPVYPAWYAGSTERLGWGDYDAEPGYLIIEMDESGLRGDPEHRSVRCRPMRGLEPVYGDTLSASEMVENVIGQLERLGDIEAITRVQLRNTDRHTAREVDRRLRREASGKCFHLSVSRFAPAVGPGTSETDGPASMRDLKSLFAQFVAQRQGEHYTSEFATRFLQRGTLALDDAQKLVDENQTEGGGS
jgi:DNA repair protein SbcD/Mre11